MPESSVMLPKPVRRIRYSGHARRTFICAGADVFIFDHVRSQMNAFASTVSDARDICIGAEITAVGGYGGCVEMHDINTAKILKTQKVCFNFCSTMQSYFVPDPVYQLLTMKYFYR